MSLTKLVDSASEKSYFEPTKPLVFRQPITTDAFGNPKVGFSDVDDGRRYRRCRLLAFYAIFFIITLVLICGLVSTMFMLGLGPFASFHHHSHNNNNNNNYPYSQCNIRLPSGGNLIEKITQPNSSDIITVSMTAFPPYPAVEILHLFSDRLTVMRTADRCYIRPMRQEMTNAKQMGYLKQLNSGTKMQDSLEGKLTSEPWTATPDDQEDPSVIHNSLIMHWCHGVPAFRLVSRKPTIPSSHWSPPPPSEELQTLVRDGQRGSVRSQDHDDDEDDDHEDDDGDAFMQLFSVHRHPRSIDLAEAMHVKPAQLPIDSGHGQQGQANRESCELVEQVLEDVVMMSADNEAKPAAQVQVTRDVIMQCHTS